MILSGVIAKSYFGTQGTMSIVEGSGSDEIFLADTYAVHVQDRNQHVNVGLKDRFSPFPGLKVKVGHYQPNGTEKIQTWIKGDVGVISGLKPFAVNNSDEPLQVGAYLQTSQESIWDVIALKTEFIEESAEKTYLARLRIKLVDPIDKKVLYEGPYVNPLPFPKGLATFQWNWNFSTIEGFSEPSVIVHLKLDKQALEEKIQISLAGSQSLKNINMTTPYLGSAPVVLDLQQTPTLLLVEDPHEDVTIFAFDQFGRIHSHNYHHGQLSSYLSYDSGFGGYAVQLELPGELNTSGRQEQEDASVNFLVEQIRTSSQTQAPLSPPLHFLRKACHATNEDFPKISLSFMQACDASRSLVCKREFQLPPLDWTTIPERELKTCYWMSVLYPDIEKELLAGHDFMTILETKKWPLTANLMGDTPALLEQMAEQIYLVADQLPESTTSTLSDVELLSAYFRLYSLQLNQILPTLNSPQPKITLESPLTTHHEKVPLATKLEENLPYIALQLEENGKKETIVLGYDRFGAGLKWPALRGKYLLRFQPQFKQIPYRIRLRNARQINYANSAQPYSYESDIIVTDRATGEAVEKTISMNNVHETWDGYRFYLANISPGNESSVNRIQLVVNHDPAKYFLTYAGGIILSLGILLLFGLRPYSKK